MEQALNDFPGSHINNVFNEGELDKKSVVAKFATSTLTHRAGKAQILFDHMAAHNYEGASIFWVRHLVAFDGEEAAIKHWQLKRDGKKRGIVEVLIHDS